MRRILIIVPTTVIMRTALFSILVLCVFLRCCGGDQLSTPIDLDDGDQLFTTIKEDIGDPSASIRNEVDSYPTTESISAGGCEDIKTVQNLMLTSGSNGEDRTFYINASWTVQENTTGCHISYNVYLFENRTHQNVLEKSIVLNDLNSCTDYTVTVELINKKIPQSKQNRTIRINNAPGIFSQFNVTNLQIATIDARTWNVTWEEPDRRVSNCVTNYYLQLWAEGETTKDFPKIDRNHRYYVVDDLVPCTNYTLQVYAQVDVKNNGLNTMISKRTNPSPTSPPVAMNGTATSKSLNILWKIDDNSTNACSLHQVEMECEASCNQNVSWIIKKGSNHTEAYLPKVYYNVEIRDLSSFTNYSCVARTQNEGGTSNFSKRFEIQTSQDVPSAPVNATVTRVTTNSFKVHWLKPSIIPSATLRYLIQIIDEGHRNLECPRNSTDPFESTVDGLEYNYEKASAYHNYTVYVYAVNDVGKGTNSTVLVSTKSERPQRALLEIGNPLIFNLSDYNVTQPITWRFEQEQCAPRSAVQYFSVHWSGYYLVSNHSDPNYNNDTVTARINSTSDYSYNITHIKPSYLYNLSVWAVLDDDIHGFKASKEFKSPDGLPSAPLMENRSDVGATTFAIYWQEPSSKVGKIINYEIHVSMNDQAGQYKDDCYSDDQPYAKKIDGSLLSYNETKALPYHQYEVFVVAYTSSGKGEASEVTSFTTRTAAPEPIRNSTITQTYSNETDHYSNSVNLAFLRPCKMNGIFIGYNYSAIGRREGYNEHVVHGPLNQAGNLNFDLKPEYTYEVNITVVTQSHQTTKQLKPFKSRAGVPIYRNGSLTAPTSTGPNQTVFKLTADSFDDLNGEILYYSVILNEEGETTSERYGFWYGDLEQWPQTKLELKPQKWNPFSNGSTVEAMILEQLTPLREDTQYYLTVRAFTAYAYRDTEPFGFRTAILEELDLALVLGLTFGLLLLVALSAFIVMLWRRRKPKQNIIQVSNVNVDRSPNDSEQALSISCEKFPNHCSHVFREDLNVMRNQYATLANESKQFAFPITYAVLQENKRKNRYTNILPYDETRVKLTIDEDDEIASDYINASYLKGYSGKVEYIATQGPLRATCGDFWKMILQENVSIIVMVAQFVEQHKEKCYNYFPSNHETTFFDAYEVKCLTELHFGTYCVRTLTVSKGNLQRTVLHMQFLEWPDFGVPTSTASMLQFLAQMRERAKVDEGLIVVHCSAGVGRTGTFIATDILLQTAEDHKDISVFKTVLDLRKERAHMVQTEKQYRFIYECLRDAMEGLVKNLDSDMSPIYENVPTRASSMEKNLIEKESNL